MPDIDSYLNRRQEEIRGIATLIYVEYHRLKQKYKRTQAKYDAILSEKEELFERTQPKAVDLDKERVTGGKAANAYDSYIIAKERKRIDERLKEIKRILDERQKLLNAKENELRASREWHDIIYMLYFLRTATVRQIERQVPYSRRQIYRILNEIRSNIRTG